MQTNIHNTNIPSTDIPNTDISDTNIALQICNRALTLVKLTPIASFSEDSKEAKLCDFLYPIIKAEVLSSYNWKSILKTILLKSFLHNSELKPNLQYKFVLPQDALKIISINSTNNYLRDGQFIWSNQSDITLNYISNSNEVELSTSLKNLISLKLTLELIQSVSENTALFNYFKNLYEENFRKALSLENTEGTEILQDLTTFEESSWIKSRS